MTDINITNYSVAGGVNETINVASIPSTYADTYPLEPVNEYGVAINNDCTLSPDYITREPIDSMYYYARDHIPNYTNISSYPNSLRYNPLTNNVTNFSNAFNSCKKLATSFETLYHRFDWESCIDMSNCFYATRNITGNAIIPRTAKDITNAFAYSGIESLVPDENGMYDFGGRLVQSAFKFCENFSINLSKCLWNNVHNTYYVFRDTNVYGTIGGMEATNYNAYGMLQNTNVEYAQHPMMPMVIDTSYLFDNCSNFKGPMYDYFSTAQFKYMLKMFANCRSLLGIIPNIPETIISLEYAFENCSSLSSSNIYILTDNITIATKFTYGCTNTMNIYVHAGSRTYDAFYKAMGGTYNADWGPAYLRTF